MRIRLVLPPLVETQKPAFVGSVLTLPNAVVESIVNLLLSNPAIAGDDVAIVNEVPVVPTKPETAPAVLEPLIVGLKHKGFCFATLREHPQYAAHVRQAAEGRAPNTLARASGVP